MQGLTVTMLTWLMSAKFSTFVTQLLMPMAKRRCSNGASFAQMEPFLTRYVHNCVSIFWIVLDGMGFSFTIFHLLRSILVHSKVHIFWEVHKFLRNLHLRFVLCSKGQICSGDFAKFCGLLRIYELYVQVCQKALDNSFSNNFSLFQLKIIKELCNKLWNHKQVVSSITVAMTEMIHPKNVRA